MNFEFLNLLPDVLAFARHIWNCLNKGSDLPQYVDETVILNAESVHGFGFCDFRRASTKLSLGI